MFLSVAEEVERIGSIFVSLLSFDDILHEGVFGFSAAEEVEDTCKIGELDIELYETSDINICLLHIDASIHALEIK